MESVIFLDTHAVIWLYAGEVQRFPSVARKKLENQPLLISPVVLLEMQYLHELGRITEEPLLMLKELEMSLGVAVHSENFERTILSALGQGWTRDPFDRIIVAHADVVSAALLTKDRSIRRNYHRAFWD